MQTLHPLGIISVFPDIRARIETVLFVVGDDQGLGQRVGENC